MKMGEREIAYAELLLVLALLWGAGFVFGFAVGHYVWDLPRPIVMEMRP